MRDTELRTDKASGLVKGKTCEDAFRRYEKEVSATKRGKEWEGKRLLLSDQVPIHRSCRALEKIGATFSHKTVPEAGKGLAWCTQSAQPSRLRKRPARCAATPVLAS